MKSSHVSLLGKILVVLFFVFSIQVDGKEIIYGANENNPRPLLLKSGDILAFSGTSSDNQNHYGKVTVLNSYGQTIEEAKSLNFKYSKNARIIEIDGGDYEGDFAVASGDEPDDKFSTPIIFDIIIFNKKGIVVQRIETKKQSTGYFIDLIYLYNNEFLLSYINQSTLYISKWKIEKNNQYEITEKTIKVTDTNRYISCKKFSTSKNIICSYVLNNRCKKEYIYFSKDLEKLGSDEIDLGSECSYNKLVTISDTEFVICSLGNGILNCKYGKENENKNENKNEIKIYEPINEIHNGCENNAMLLDVNYFDERQFTAVCRETSSKIRLFKVKIVCENENENEQCKMEKTSKIIEDNSEGVELTCPFVTKFNGNFISIFYHRKIGSIENEWGDNIYTIPGFPYCEDHKEKFDVGTETIEISFLKYLEKEKKLKLKIIEGEIYTKDNTAVKSNSVYDIDQSFVISKEKSREVNVIFAGVVEEDGQDREGKRCNLTITFECDYQCKSCEGTKDQCTDCNLDYYPKYSEKRKETFNCFKGLEGFYLGEDESGKTYYYYECHENCKQCSGAYSETNNNCIKCKDNRFFLEETKNCEEKKDGLYLDNEDKLQKCYKTCKTCIKGGDDDNHNCIDCLDSSYFKTDTQCLNCGKKFYQLGKGCVDKCDEGYVPNNNKECVTCAIFGKGEYYYEGECHEKILDGTYFEEENNSLNILKKCAPNCKTCQKPQDGDKDNCEECYTGYYKEEGNCIQEGVECYETCKECYKKGEEPKQNCKVCKNGFEYTTGNELGNCLDSTKLPPNLDEVGQFLPIQVTLKSENDIKTVPISEDNSIYYYYSGIMFGRNDIPYVNLGECENTLKKKGVINSNDKLLIGMIVKKDNTGDIQYSVYTTKNEKVDISSCQDVSIVFPIVKNNNASSLIYSALSNGKNLKKINIYDSEEEFYNDPCSAYEIDGKEISLEERQKMYVDEIQFCPSEHCELESYSVLDKTVKCQCGAEQNIIKDENKIFSSIFKTTSSQFSFSLFKCSKVFKHYPSDKSYLHWIILAFAVLAIAVFVLLEINLKKYMETSLPNPNKKSKFRRHHAGNEKTDQESGEKWIEMEEQNSEGNSPTSPKKSPSRVSRSPRMRSPFLREGKRPAHLKKDGFRLNNVSEGVSFYSGQSCRELFCKITKLKLLMLSMFTNDSSYYVIHMRIIWNLTIFGLIIFINALLYEDINRTFPVEIGIYCALINFVIYKIGFVLMTQVCTCKKFLRLSGIVEFIFGLAFLCVSWYYLYIFGVIHSNEQGKVLLLTLLSFGSFIFVQTIFAAIISVIASLCVREYSHTVENLCKVLYLIF